MANTSNPRGFWPIRHLTGGQIRANEYIATTGTTFGEGEVLKVVAGGTVEKAAAADGIIVVGIAAEGVTSAAAGTTVRVYDDPYIVFGVECATAAATDVFATADHVYGAATYGVSRSYLAAVADAQFKILGKISSPDNEWGAYVKVEVMFNEHLYKAAVAGV